MIAIAPVANRHAAEVDPDAALMLRVREGETEVFPVLVDRYYERVLFVIRHLMANSQQAEDLAQEVFLRVYRARNRYRPESKFSTWLFVIVNNVVRNARRTLARRREVPQGVCQGPAGCPYDASPRRHRRDGPFEEAVRCELRETVRLAMDGLNGRQKTAVLLYHFQGYNYAEVAHAMDTTLSATKALLHRARLSLRGQLQPYVNAN